MPADRLLRGLRGKDVLVVFVESYGRVAVQGTSFSPGVDAVLDDGSRRLRAAGYGARSAFLTSPTFGAGELAGPLHAPVGAVGRQPAAATTSSSAPTGSR